MMRRNKTLPAYLRIILALACLSSITPGLPAHAAQAATNEPRRERLLNGLPLLLAYRPGDPQVLLKLRLQSGAAFDLAGKEGMMALLSDVLFPDPTTREFVTEELGGQLTVTTDYDQIEVTLSGRATEFERLAELLRNAVVNTRIVADDVTRLRDERLKAARAAALAPAALADRAVATRLYGSHPYGRLIIGTPESLARIDRVDLLLARDRFVTADNARLVVMGGVEPGRVLRVFRQFLGSWRKSEALVPATFRRPDAPDPRTLIIDQTGAAGVEIRLALRGLARTDRDHAAAAVVAALARARWQAALGTNSPDSLSVQHEAHTTGGFWQMSARVRPAIAAQALATARATLNALMTAPPSAAELEQAKHEATTNINPNKSPDIALADQWLDVESYGPTAADTQRTLAALTPADVQRVAARLFRDAGVASVAVGPAAELSSELARTTNGVEIFGAPGPAPTPTPARRP